MHTKLSIQWNNMEIFPQMLHNAIVQQGTNYSRTFSGHLLPAKTHLKPLANQGEHYDQQQQQAEQD